MPKWILFFLLIPSLCFASEYTIDSSQTSIKTSVRYTVLGVYTAEFQDIQSALFLDMEIISNSFVEMVFQTASIDSGMARFDRIVRSQRLLDADQYPEITFRSTMISKKKDGYWVEGELDLHGVKQTLEFPFQLEEMKDGVMRAQGKWHIKRKKFGIIWHPLFDVGGILVSNTITIDWQILAEK